MIVLLLIAAFAALGLAGLRWGADSRDGKDWGACASVSYLGNASTC